MQVGVHARTAAADDLDHARRRRDCRRQSQRPLLGSRPSDPRRAAERGRANRRRDGKGILTSTIRSQTGLPQGLSFKLSNAIVDVVAQGLSIDSAPDPFGTAYVTTGQGSFPQQLLKHDNTFMPEWTVTWTA